MQEVGGLYSDRVSGKNQKEYSQGQGWGARGECNKKKKRRTTATTNGNNVVTATRAKYSVLPVCVCVGECVSLACTCMTLSPDVH